MQSPFLLKNIGMGFVFLHMASDRLTYYTLSRLKRQKSLKNFSIVRNETADGMALPADYGLYSPFPLRYNEFE